MNQHRIVIGDIVSVAQTGRVLIDRGVVHYMPVATGDSWIIEQIDNGQVHYISELVTITKLYRLKISFWWLHGNMGFTKIPVASLDEIAAFANMLRKDDVYGALCPSILLFEDDGKEYKRVGTMANSSPDDANWNQQLKRWLSEQTKDNDVLRLTNF